MTNAGHEPSDRYSCAALSAPTFALASMLILWAGNASEPLTVTVPISTTGVDFLGDPIPLESIDETLLLTLTESTGPVYFTWRFCPTSLHSVYLPVVVRE
jgi:hypothetical protein